MSVALLAPLGLAAVAALALPLLIHLIRRDELSVTEFSALRWIAARAHRRRRIRFERPWLLLLRLLLLALLALLLARPVWIESPAALKPQVLVAPGVDRAAARAAVAGLDADWRWVAPGFPSFDTAAPAAAVALASLLRELDADLAPSTPLHVIVPAELAGLDGARPQLARALDWHVVPGRTSEPAAAAPRAPVRFAVRYAPQAEPALRYLRAAVAAWNADEPDRYRLDAQALAAPLAGDTRWLVWLAAPPTPAVLAWIERGGVAVLAQDDSAVPAGDPLWRDGAGKVLARSAAHGSGRVVALAGALTPADLPILLDPDFPQRLRAALHGAAPAPTRAPAAALQPRRGAATGAGATPLDPARPLDAWLTLLIGALFLIERLLATRLPLRTRP